MKFCVLNKCNIAEKKSLYNINHGDVCILQKVKKKIKYNKKMYMFPYIYLYSI